MVEREGVKNTFRVGVPQNDGRKTQNPVPPIKFVSWTCTPPKMLTIVMTPHTLKMLRKTLTLLKVVKKLFDPS